MNLTDSHNHPMVPGPSPEEQEGFVVIEDDGRRRMFDHPSNVKLVIRWFVRVCMVLALIDIAYYLLDSVFHVFGKDPAFHAHNYFNFDGLPLFYPAYGFVACVLLVLAAKQLRKILMRDENYYDS